MSYITQKPGTLVYHGKILAGGAILDMSADIAVGWSINKLAIGDYEITHPLGTNAMTIVGTLIGTIGYAVTGTPTGNTKFRVFTYSSSGSAIDAAVCFSVIPIL